MNEFDFIEKYFAPLSKDGLKNDAAVLEIPDGHELIVTSDALNAGTHFMPDADPALIAHKTLRVNLSDLAAMGAEPLAYQLCIAFPEKPDEEWLKAFTNALQKDQQTFGIFCSGGDTTSINGPLSVSITAMGLVPKGQAVTRNGAQDNDTLVLTGHVGDACIGLKILQGEIESNKAEYFIDKYYKPAPRTDLTSLMREHAHAAIDISDGLLADLAHICKASGLGAELQITDQMFSEQAQTLLHSKIVTPETLLSSGDDYQLLLAVPEEAVATILEQAPGSIKIGTFTAEKPGISVLDKNGHPVDIKHTGWSHF